jgi:hypothetical protein
MYPSDRVAQLYPQALGSLFIASYDSQGYGGGIITSLHTKISSLILMMNSVNTVVANSLFNCTQFLHYATRFSLLAMQTKPYDGQ